MSNKNVFNYVIGAVAGVGLMVGSAAFAATDGHDDHHNESADGKTTQQATQKGMTDKTTQGGTTGKSGHNSEQGNTSNEHGTDGDDGKHAGH